MIHFRLKQGYTINIDDFMNTIKVNIKHFLEGSINYFTNVKSITKISLTYITNNAFFHLRVETLG